MRRIIAVLLALTILLPFGLSASGTQQAFAATNNAPKIMEALGIMTTDKGDISETTEKITRSQYAQLLVNMSSLKDTTAISSNVSLFSDVSKKYWAAGYIKTAISNGWMYGYLNGSFRPTKGVTLLEAVNGVLKLLGYTDSDFTGNTAAKKMALYVSKGLNVNITVSKKTAALDYDNCVNLFYNTLKATTKDSKIYAETLGYTLDSNGELDYLSLMNSNIEGPVIADGNWKQEISFNTVNATYYKNGIKCTYTDIEDYDVLYYSETFKTIWAYDDRVTGTVESINPDYLSPVSVTVAGNTYTLGTSDAALEFSSVGDVKEGDIITLLLGKDNEVAAVLNVDELNTTITGVVLSVGTHLVENADGDYESMAYATFVDASGNEYNQDYDEDVLTFVEDEIIRISYKDGTATVSKVTVDSISDNVFNADASKFGNTDLAANVKILDLKNGVYMSLYPTRLAGVTLRSASLYYYELNEMNEISKLILYDASGDLDQYGIFTGMGTSNSSKMSYNYLIDGKEGSLNTSSLSSLNMEEGATGFVFEDDAITSSYKLAVATVTGIGSTSIQSSTGKYTLAGNYDVYCLVDDEYVATTIDKVSDLLKYKVTAYYDRASTNGGRIRIIVAESIN